MMHVTIYMCVLCAALSALCADAQLCTGTYGNLTQCPSLNGAPTMRNAAQIADFESNTTDLRREFLALVSLGAQVNTSMCWRTYELVACYEKGRICDRVKGLLLLCSQLCVDMVRCMPTPLSAEMCVDVSAKPDDLCWGRGGVQREPHTRPHLSSLATGVRPGYAVLAAWLAAWLAAARTRT